MKLKVVIHTAEEGGYWTEIPAILGCATQGETYEELLQNTREAIEGYFSVDEIKFWMEASQTFLYLGRSRR